MLKVKNRDYFMEGSYGEENKKWIKEDDDWIFNSKGKKILRDCQIQTDNKIN